jgi:hypothetical protein
MPGIYGDRRLADRGYPERVARAIQAVVAISNSSSMGTPYLQGSRPPTSWTCVNRRRRGRELVREPACDN